MNALTQYSTDLTELVMVPKKCLCLVCGIFFFFGQNNTHFQTISLVNNVSNYLANQHLEFLRIEFIVTNRA